ncbi:aldolase [Psychrobacillus sp. NPDC096426]|uniref:aldolase n=1 Tax=Psychrobacillus sp. NPDC096426 TaxID=3364491 RepID=UPI003826FC3D
MVETIEKYCYKAFGLKIVSDIPLPELLFLKMEDNQANCIFIKKEDLNDFWSKHSYPARNFVITEQFIMFQIPNKAIFLIQNGNEILYSPIYDNNVDLLRIYILGTCMGALLMQRKTLPLHGSAIAIDGKAYAIVGDSGAGKSTLAKAFLMRGYQLLSDDVIPITFSENQIAYVMPSYPHQKLWMESLNEFGLESNQFQPLAERETKFSVPVLQFLDEPLPLAGIFALTKTESEDVSINSITIMERFQTLFHNTYRNIFLSRAGLMDWHFNTSAMMVNKIPMYQIRRPISHFTAYELTELMLTEIQPNVVMKD